MNTIRSKVRLEHTLFSELVGMIFIIIGYMRRSQDQIKIYSQTENIQLETISGGRTEKT